jgi:hypothetical protein
VPGKRVQFDQETWNAIDLLARDSMKDFQELADEAFRDLLKKHGRPTDLKSALRQSAGQRAEIHYLRKKEAKPKKPLRPSGQPSFPRAGWRSSSRGKTRRHTSHQCGHRRAFA